MGLPPYFQTAEPGRWGIEKAQVQNSQSLQRADGPTVPLKGGPTVPLNGGTPGSMQSVQVDERGQVEPPYFHVSPLLVP